MFSAMDIANGGGNQQMVLRNNHQQQHGGGQQGGAAPGSQQMFSYGYQQQQQQPTPQQQQSYFTAYPNTNTNSPQQQQQKSMNHSGSANSNMGFIQPNAPYMQQQQQHQQQQQPQQQQVFPYGYQQQQQQPYMQQQHQQQQHQQPMRGYNSVNQQQQQPPYMQQQHHQQHGGRGGGGGRGRGGYNNFVPHYRQVHNNYYYNQQHHYSSNNAVPEKTATVLLMHPTTKKVMRIKQNRIYNTMADMRPKQQPGAAAAASATAPASAAAASTSETGSVEAPSSVTPSRIGPAGLVLCLDFLSPRGCVHGSGCDKVHVAGLEYMWDPIEVTSVVCDDVEKYNKGFRVHCYDPSLTKYYNIPSEDITVTKGSTEYIDMYNEHGDNFKKKFKVCSAVLDSAATCAAGSECGDIHCSTDGLTAAEDLHSHATHVNNAESMQSVARLPADMKVRVFDQNSADSFHDYPGTNVLMTEGAKTYAKYYEQELNKIPVRKRMQHCAHFRLKDMCRLGESCRFLHVLPTPEELQQRLEKEREAAKAAEEQEQMQQALATAEE